LIRSTWALRYPDSYCFRTAQPCCRGTYLPRGIEFLYSKNRLNVALSRAKCLAILVASPRLLDVECRTAEQIRLVNTLCWVEEYSRRC